MFISYVVDHSNTAILIWNKCCTLCEGSKVVCFVEYDDVNDSRWWLFSMWEAIFVFNDESKTVLDQFMLSYLQRSDEIYTCLKVYLFIFTPICLQHTLAIICNKAWPMKLDRSESFYFYM